MPIWIRNPYDTPGEYRKAQLHCHTTESDGRFRPRELLEMYKKAGYSFVCITDHNRATRYDDLNDSEFLAVPGTEDTVPRPFRPLGPHVVRLFADRSLPGGSAQDFIGRTVADHGVASLAHPSWTGNLWTGGWAGEEIQNLRGYQLIEIWNPHSNPAEDRRRWTAVLRARGRESPVWGVAVDDCHHQGQFNRGWIMVKVPEVSAAALRQALLNGSFYASTGVLAEFGVRGEAIEAKLISPPHPTPLPEVARVKSLPSPPGGEGEGEGAYGFRRPILRFIDIGGNVRQESSGSEARYAPKGDEGFVRVECEGPEGRAWSQPLRIQVGAK